MALFEKILIANRGEIAVRIIRACRELDIKTVAVYSDVERDSMHVQLADEALCIGPASAQLSYLNIPAILTAADITDATAIHPGYGFLAENAHFAETCHSSGIVFIGPTPENIRLGGDKSQARQLLKRKGVPVIPGSDDIVTSEDEAFQIARGIGYPVILKAAHGGGGRGMKIVIEEGDLRHAFQLAQREAVTAFGRKDLYIEKYLTNLRHIEIQIMADHTGEVVHLGERDCSVQRRHQKLIEESPSPSASPRVRKKLYEYAIKAAKALQYRNVGTVEFAVDSHDGVYFMEINTRIQVEHPVTETVTGVDIVKEQIKLAAGHPLSLKQSQVSTTGHAIECRINAEDPERFVPSPGRITSLYLPGGPGVRVDTAAYAGWVVPPYYDSLVAKLIVHGKDRPEAIARMLRSLAEFRIEGIKTTVSFHERVMRHEDFIKGRCTTSFVDGLNARE
jgi:acetyl-CoA carboxylase biotin carboxylase subunit